MTKVLQHSGTRIGAVNRVSSFSFVFARERFASVGVQSVQVKAGI